MKYLPENAVVKEFLTDEDFKHDKSKHKFVLLWSSKFYRIINKIIRLYPLEVVLSYTKYTKYFMKKMVQYFYDNGYYKTELLQRGKYLYRGLDKDFSVPSTYKEKTFMSTSLCHQVAQTFAGSGGNIITFSISKLPSDVPFIIIDENIDECLAEQEVLFLPGTITTIKTSTGYKAYYKMSHKFQKLMSQLLGGNPNHDMIKPIIPHINLKGKYIVWWRAIHGRKVELVGRIEMPKKEAEVDKFFRDVILPHDDKFELKTDFIPQFQDLKKKWDKRTEEEETLYRSYFVHMAVYDAKEKKVLCLRYGMFDAMVGELCNTSRDKEVEKKILKECAWLC